MVIRVKIERKDIIRCALGFFFISSAVSGVENPWIKVENPWIEVENPLMCESEGGKKSQLMQKCLS
jgi:hypothetical protein